MAILIQPWARRVCAILIHALKMGSYGDTLRFVLLVGIGYLFTNTITINPSIPRPFCSGLITGSFHLAGMLLTNLILVAMK